jgi:hypothetical protein
LESCIEKKYEHSTINTAAENDELCGILRTSGTCVRINVYPQATWAIKALWALRALTFFAPAIHTEYSTSSGFLEVRPPAVIDSQFGDVRAIRHGERNH